MAGGNDGNGCQCPTLNNRLCSRHPVNNDAFLLLIPALLISPAFFNTPLASFHDASAVAEKQTRAVAVRRTIRLNFISIENRDYTISVRFMFKLITTFTTVF